MKQNLAKLTEAYNQIQNMVLDTLHEQPKDADEMASLSATIYSQVTAAGLLVQKIERMPLKVLADGVSNIRMSYDQVWEQVLQLPKIRDRLKFMIAMGQLLPLFGKAIDAVIRLEYLRFQHSNMRRWEEDE